MVVIERGGGEEEGYQMKGAAVPVEQFEELVSSKYEDEMCGFQEEFAVSIY